MKTTSLSVQLHWCLLVNHTVSCSSSCVHPPSWFRHAYAIFLGQWAIPEHDANGGLISIHSLEDALLESRCRVRSPEYSPGGSEALWEEWPWVHRERDIQSSPGLSWAWLWENPPSEDNKHMCESKRPVHSHKKKSFHRQLNHVVCCEVIGNCIHHQTEVDSSKDAKT